jgi:hypothetical protein
VECVLAIVAIQMVDFSVEHEARISYPVGYASDERSKICRAILISKVQTTS